MSNCLICANPIENGGDYHKKCLQNLFGTDEPPVLDYQLSDIEELAKKEVNQRITVPGVQSKLSLEIKQQTDQAKKLTIVGLWGRYILKPLTGHWPELPENEHATMMMAEVAGLETVPFGLIKLASGERAYITRRIDRNEAGNKFAMEDMCQLTERLTEDKYKGSHEQIAKKIKEFSANPLYDLTRYFEVVLFTWLTGNSDMHLKNFSLLKDPQLGWKLSPAYDLLSTRLVIPAEKDPEELALTLTGKKSNFSPSLFQEFGLHIGLNKKQVDNILEKMIGNRKAFKTIVDKSFLSVGMKEIYLHILNKRFDLFD